MQLGVFIPIGNNGWLISTTSPQYMPSFDLNRVIVEKAERFGFEFALSMIKLRGSGDAADQAVRDVCGADDAATDCGAHGGDDRQHCAGAIRGEHHLGLAAG
jgi:hypothetical protein